MTNTELASSLRATADAYENLGADMPRPSLIVFANSKDETIALIKAIGGKFRKDMSDESQLAYIRFHSARIPGFAIWLSRDKVCRRVTKWECEPLLSKQEEAELDGVIA